MLAMTCHMLGEDSPLTLDDRPAPALRPGTVRIRVAAAGVNFADRLLIAGRYQDKCEPPFTPGFEVAGYVLETSPDVQGFAIGATVLAVVRDGGYAEEVVAPATMVLPLPESMPIEVGAGFPIAYGTSHHALTACAALKPGQSLLVHGAAGGVGRTAVMIGKQLGATVIATASSAEKRAAVQEFGADHVLDPETPDWGETVKALCHGLGADVVYDPVGGTLFERSLRCTRPGGRLLTIGFASGSLPQIPANLLLVKNLTVIGYSWGGQRALDVEAVRHSLQTVLSWYHSGRLAADTVSRLPLSAANVALARLRDRQVIGKLVLCP